MIAPPQTSATISHRSGPVGPRGMSSRITATTTTAPTRCCWSSVRSATPPMQPVAELLARPARRAARSSFVTRATLPPRAHCEEQRDLGRGSVAGPARRRPPLVERVRGSSSIASMKNPSAARPFTYAEIGRWNERVAGRSPSALHRDRHRREIRVDAAIDELPTSSSPSRRGEAGRKAGWVITITIRPCIGRTAHDADARTLLERVHVLDAQQEDRARRTIRAGSPSARGQPPRVADDERPRSIVLPAGALDRASGSRRRPCSCAPAAATPRREDALAGADLEDGLPRCRSRRSIAAGTASAWW